MKKTVIFIISCLLWFESLNAQTNVADRILGDWISPDKDLIVRCYKEDNLYYSKIVWFKRYYDNTPDDPNGIPESKWLDAVVMDKFTYQDNEWTDGEIWNLKNGKKYSAYAELNNNADLRVVGYVFFRLFSETVVFKRYTGSKLPDFN